VSTLTAPALVGGGVLVPLVDGGRAREVNLDFAASTPALTEVADAVAEFLPWYSSVHRGAGWKSQVATAALEASRDQVARFVGARPDDVVVFTGNTTHSINVLAAAVPRDCTVIGFASEHHANLLPWRNHTLITLPVVSGEDAALAVLEDALSGCSGPALVAVTGASNVTGEIWPIAKLAALAHRYGARIAVDGAQLAPHVPIDIAAADVDWISISGHKLYAPFGAGALVGRRDWLDAGEPLIRGGGAVRFVTEGDVAWDCAPARYEAGSPNVIGIVALGTACRVLAEYGMERIFEHDQALCRYAFERCANLTGLTRYGRWPDDHPRIALITFNLAGWKHGLLGAALSAEHGIAVRDGCFCAHPLLLELLDVPTETALRLHAQMRAGQDPELPGAVRVSAGLSTTRADIDAVAEALAVLAANGPRLEYLATGHGQYVPMRDDRRPPQLRVLPAR
jgi:selenocysteine lyase/cysteine desulfurase